MPQTATITLSSAGVDNGTFSLYSDVDSFAVAFETGISKANMLAGYTTSLIPNGTTVIRVKKEGCPTYLDLELPCYSCDNCISPFDIFFNSILEAKQTNPGLTWDFIINDILGTGVVAPQPNVCCPDCGDTYTFASVETWLKYAEAVGSTAPGPVPA